ncbi:MAG: zf-HC2 domain-containing protein [Treponema sp.]|jgi:anti-sigma factor RsiW|nr:zf-HC2 domain-containing protein [Treponema sp.]
MCPDTQLLSIYIDGELPSPWKEKLETHLQQCSSCSKKLFGYRQLRETVRNDPEFASIEEARDKIWLNLSSHFKVPDNREYPGSRNSGSFTFNRFNRAKMSRPFWQNHVSIPLPAAAAAVILLLFAVFWLRGESKAGLKPDANSSVVLAADEAPGIIPADMSSVLKYLDTEGADILILRLPESRKFMNSGEPAIINAVDYSRRYP